MPLIPLMTNQNTVVSLPAMDIGLSMDMGDVLLVRYVGIPSMDMAIGVGSSGVVQNVVIPDAELYVSLNASVLQQAALPPFSLGIAMVFGAAYAFDTGSAIVRYFCILTGTADGVSDLLLPMKSFQARRRSGDPTYLSVVVPTVDYADEIAARPNGSLKIQQAYEQNNVIRQVETIMEVDLYDVRPNEGGTNVSVTLTGYSSSSYTAKTVSLRGVTYRTVSSGKYRYRMARPYVFLNPGDTVTILDDGVVFEIDTISYFIDAMTSMIELGST